MRLIGNKTRLLGDIESLLAERGIRGGIFIDIFTGTASVARRSKALGFRVIANDLLSACYTQAVAAVEVSSPPPFQKLLGAHRRLIGSRAFQEGLAGDPRDPLHAAIHLLNRFVEPRAGLIFRSFSPGGEHGRRYFRDDHGRKIDGILEFLRDHRRRRLLERRELHLLLAALIDAADRRANITGTYGAFLKSWQVSTLGELMLEAPEITPGVVRGHRAYRQDANRLVRRIAGDVLYIDPPYNHRQYAANYHVLEIIAEHHRIRDLDLYERSLYGKTGLRPYEDQHSAYCVRPGRRGLSKRDPARRDVFSAMEDLVLSANVDHVVVSYNEEGLLGREDLGEILARFSGRARFNFAENFREVRYRRFRSDRDRDPAAGSGNRRYRVIDGRGRDEIAEWLLFASRKGVRASRARTRPGAAQA